MVPTTPSKKKHTTVRPKIITGPDVPQQLADLVKAVERIELELKNLHRNDEDIRTTNASGLKAVSDTFTKALQSQRSDYLSAIATLQSENTAAMAKVQADYVIANEKVTQAAIIGVRTAALEAVRTTAMSLGMKIFGVISTAGITWEITKYLSSGK